MQVEQRWSASVSNTGRVVVAVLLAGMGQLTGQTAPFSMPAWLEPSPGASVESRTSRGMVTATYETAAPVTDVVAHYGELFAAQGVRFRPEMYGATAVINGDVPGCALTIQVRKRAAGASVQITATQRPIIPKVTQQDIRQAMRKYDQPVYPTPKAPMPTLRWPSWLTTCDDVAGKIRRGVDRFKLAYLETEFDSAQEREAIQQFYVELLNSNGYPVTIESSPITPPERKAMVEGTRTFDGARRFVIRVELTPTAAGAHVVLRITAHV
jgi:hypothetical protein